MQKPTSLQRAEIEQKLRDCTLEGYITGMDRSKDWLDSLSAHIYAGTFDAPEYGLCKRSMDSGGGFSIFRNNVGRKGICKICMRKLMRNLSSN